MSPHLPSHAWQIRGTREGPNVVIMGGTHGDELTGIQLIRDWLSAIDPTTNLLLRRPGVYELEGVAGTLHLVFGNPEAIVRNNRGSGMEPNLNRCFDPALLQDQTRSWPDLERARELLPLLERTNLLIDVHAVSEMNSEPFICFGDMTPELDRLGRSFPVKHILNDPYGVLGGPEGSKELPTTDQIVNRSGGIGICYETGHLGDMTKLPLAKTVVARILQEQGVINQEIYTRLLPSKEDLKQAETYFEAFEPKKQHRLRLIAFQLGLQPKGSTFTFQPGMRAWTQVHKGQLYGRYQDGQEIHIPEGGFLVFPTPASRMSDTSAIFYIAQEF